MVLGLLLVAAAALVARPQPLSSTGADQVRDLASAAPAPEQAAPGIPVRRGEPPAPRRAEVPVAVHIDALDVSAEVDEVGVDTDTGQLEIPEQVDRLGWYRHGPGLDATAGSIVIAGHVDTVGAAGALYRLGELEPGDTVEVTGADGDTRSFRVVAREVHRKAEIPLERYFARDGAPRLTLITCGGPFDRDLREYRDNVVVTAVPTG